MFSGIAWYRAIPPKFALSQPRGGGGRGYRSSSCPLEDIVLYVGIAEIVSPIAALWATKGRGRGGGQEMSVGQEREG